MAVHGDEGLKLSESNRDQAVTSYKLLYTAPVLCFLTQRHRQAKYIFDWNRFFFRFGKLIDVQKPLRTLELGIHGGLSLAATRPKFPVLSCSSVGTWLGEFLPIYLQPVFRKKEIGSVPFQG